MAKLIVQLVVYNLLFVVNFISGGIRFICNSKGAHNVATEDKRMTHAPTRKVVSCAALHYA